MSLLELSGANSAQPAYYFTVSLELQIYSLNFYFNRRMATWFMDIRDSGQNDLLCGIPLLTNVDMTSRYSIIGLPPGAFVVFDTTGQNNNPTRDNLGSYVKLYYIESGTQ